jgi:hypothetical protein
MVCYVLDGVANTLVEVPVGDKVCRQVRMEESQQQQHRHVNAHSDLSTPSTLLASNGSLHCTQTARLFRTSMTDGTPQDAHTPAMGEVGSGASHPQSALLL